MSHSVVINYRGVAIETMAICNNALSQICRIDALIERIKSNGLEFIDDEIMNLEKSLLQKKKIMIEKVNALIGEAKTQSNMSTRHGTRIEKVSANKILVRSRKLVREIDDFSSKEVYMIDELITNKLDETLLKNSQEIKDRVDGLVRLSTVSMNMLSSIDDLYLRELTYNEMVENGLVFEVAYSNARIKCKENLRSVFRKNKTTIIHSVRQDLESNHMSEEIISSLLEEHSNDLVNLRVAANKEIIGEEVRKETLKVILKLIRKQGFIVDAKKNIKLNKEKNELILRAKKASGENANFKIHLDGKFVYRFDGYEGQACQEDIEPFMSDLENVYGIEVLDRKEIWKNPDKISSMKCQSMKQGKQK